jgi:broad specificity phosphatase PhoE
MPHDDDEPWWYHTENNYNDNSGQTHTGGGVDVDVDVDEWRPCDAHQWYAVPGEPHSVLQARLDRFEDWLSRTRPEHTICLVSHWAVLRHFTQGYEFDNCEAQWRTWQRTTQPMNDVSANEDEHW